MLTKIYGVGLVFEGSTVSIHLDQSDWRRWMSWKNRLVLTTFNSAKAGKILCWRTILLIAFK
jgi:uncharacterized protein YfaQ (DUF2300 family)